MTLDQAIDRYTNNAEYERIHGSLQGCLEFRQLAEWLKNYKRLLEQQPCEDAISRQAVLDGLASIAKVKAKSDAQKSLMGRVMFFVEKLPPVTPQPKTGHWIKDDITERSKSAYKHKCDRCGAYHRAMYDYCPSCGIKMVEPQESEGEDDKRTER